MSLYRETMGSQLLFGVPAKGRIFEATDTFLREAGLAIIGQAGREYFGHLDGFPEVAVAFLPASEIALALERGELHLGISGKDLLHENIEAPEESLALIENLGFSHADLCVGVPKSWIDVEDMDDLDDIARNFYTNHRRLLRVATKYPRLTRQIFGKHGVDMYRIVASLGATEGAPRAGFAEVIVDITSTGATLDSNGLKRLKNVYWGSQAQLAASRAASWSKIALELAKEPLNRISEHLSRDGNLWLKNLTQSIKI